ncbi:hypothetical protein BDP27DRAFT_1357252 [Rhodocollybia butyracea]|uniref:Uncharacterized protein n=1 Tax=Rhodocollybia butyracea TaxID=206335 RepID=A0A9P5QA85_9AGAR|nr:hypothetical protein BDP27DRAFT_1357252 [Rhodocollybia butyracea]
MKKNKLPSWLLNTFPTFHIEWAWDRCFRYTDDVVTGNAGWKPAGMSFGGGKKISPAPVGPSVGNDALSDAVEKVNHETNAFKRVMANLITILSGERVKEGMVKIFACREVGVNSDVWSRHYKFIVCHNFIYHLLCPMPSRTNNQYYRNNDRSSTGHRSLSTTTLFNLSRISVYGQTCASYDYTGATTTMAKFPIDSCRWEEAEHDFCPNSLVLELRRETVVCRRPQRHCAYDIWTESDSVHPLGQWFNKKHIQKHCAQLDLRTVPHQSGLCILANTKIPKDIMGTKTNAMMNDEEDHDRR